MKGIKVLFSTIIFVLALADGLAASAGTSQAAMSKAKQHELYKTTMAQYDKDVRKRAKEVSDDYMDVRGQKTYYAFVDIDKNGIDECILRYGGSSDTANSSGYGENTSIYTIKNNKVIAVLEKHKNFHPAEHGDYVRIYKSRKWIDLGFSHDQGDYLFCEYKNGKIKQEGRIRICFYTNQAGKNVASINEKKIVSAAAGKKQYNQLSNKGKGYKMKVYKG